MSITAQSRLLFTSTLPNQFITREGEAPAEPLRRQLGRSLALPLFFKRLGIAKMFTGVGSGLPGKSKTGTRFNVCVRPSVSRLAAITIGGYD